MRTLWLKARHTVDAHPRVWLAAGLIAVAVVALGATWLVANPQRNASANLPTATATERWTLLDVASRIDAGDVKAITVGAANSGAKVLLAQLQDGVFVAITGAGTIADEASALQTLGYGDLLTPTAQAAIAERPGAGPTANPLQTIVSLVMLLLLVVVGGAFLYSSRDRIPVLNRRSTRFATIMPTALPAPPSGSVGASAAEAPVPFGSPGLVNLSDVAGCEEAKLELAEPIEFLRHPARFKTLGAKVPRGILLYGPPGTGKTMLARAVATEAGVPFLHASGSDFVEKYVGVGARRVRDLFGHAKRLGKAVIFIDEFDALGKARGGQNSHEEREQTLNQLLVELDGFGTSGEIVVIAATNRLDILDEALLRPGRFSRKVHVGLPDVAGRVEILKVHARGKPLAEDVELDALARKTYGFSGAQLADLLNEAAIMAARRGSATVDNEDMHAGWLKVAVGTGRRRSMNERDRAIIAAHEVGHAICGKVHGDSRRVEEISLFAHGEALGVTVSSQEDNDLPAESDLRARLVALMGGRAAEELLFHEVTPGAANDFEKATQIATSMVNRWGMGRDPKGNDDSGSSGRGTLSLFATKRDGNLPSELQGAATRAIAAILDEAYAAARQTLIDHLDQLRKIGVYLVQQERIDGDTFDALYDGRIEVPDADVEWRPAAARPREWASIGAMSISKDPE